MLGRCIHKIRTDGLRLASLAFVVLFAMFALPCQGQDGKPNIAPPSSWIVPILFNPRATLSPVDPFQPMRWILQDTQINAESDEQFVHEVRQILTPASVNNDSAITIPYDPSYQLLTFHWVTIWRGTNEINVLDPARIAAAQAAPTGNELLFSAEKAIVLPIEDVQVGDIIDFAYTAEGANPVFAGSFSGRIQTMSGHPVDQSTTRLLWPTVRHLYVQNHGTDVKYSATRRGNMIEFTWNMRNTPGWPEESALPPWYQPYPWVQLSEFQKWSDVNRFVLDLFANREALSPELTQQINGWKKLPDEERVLTALRFVQDNIQSAAVGAGSTDYRPASPSTVFAHKAGDSKDKNLLLTAMLQAMGIDAWPVIVNTKLRQGLVQLHPAASVFDHAITLVTLGGRNFWLDPSAAYQRGPLAVRSWPNYGFGLVTKPGTTALTEIPPSPVQPKTTVSEYITLTGWEQPASVKIVTVAENQDADQWRAQMAGATTNQIESRNLARFAKYYPDAKMSAPPIFSDDGQRNRIEMDEFYVVPKIGVRLPDQNNLVRCSIYPIGVETVMPPLPVGPRTMPLAVSYPEHQIFHADITIPMLSLAGANDQVIQNPAFYFHRTTSLVEGKIFVDYEYQALADTVPSPSLPAYIQQLGTATALMPYDITSN